MTDELIVAEDHPVDRPKGGRPKGSRNKITLIKLMAEEAVRSNHLDQMLEVCTKIIEAALEGDRDCRKLVWQSIMSKSGTDQAQTSGEAPRIIINTDQPVQMVQQNLIDVSPEDDSNG